jgi:hypothetical protein
MPHTDSHGTSKYFAFSACSHHNLLCYCTHRTAPHYQSVNSEVQERASTLRYLLAEMEILPMSWENQAEEIKPGEKPAGAKGAKKGEIKAAIKEMNLLDEVDDLLDMPGVSVCLSA